MAIIRWKNNDPDSGEPFDIFEKMDTFEEMEMDTIKEDTSILFHETWHPKLYLSEDHDNVYLMSRLPGIIKDAIKVSLHNHILTVTLKVVDEKLGETITKNDTHSQKTTRTLNMSLLIISSIDEKNIRATITGDFFRLILPKKEWHGPRNIRLELND